MFSRLNTAGALLLKDTLTLVDEVESNYESTTLLTPAVIMLYHSSTLTQTQGIISSFLVKSPPLRTRTEGIEKNWVKKLSMSEPRVSVKLGLKMPGQCCAGF